MLNMSSHKARENVFIMYFEQRFFSVLIFVAIWEYPWIPCLCSPFLLRYPQRPYVESMWCPLKQIFPFKMLHFAVFYVLSIDIPLHWHRSDQLANGHNAQHTDGMRGKSQKKKHVNQLWVLMA